MNLHDLRKYDLLYLATPYTLYPQGQQKAFEDAALLAGVLLNKGIHVFSPITHGHPMSVYGDVQPINHSLWLTYDKKFMDRMDACVVGKLDGWEASYGIAHEIEAFLTAGKPVYFLDPLTLETYVYAEAA